MKKVSFLIVLLLLNNGLLLSQVGINSDESAPDSSAMLDVQSASKGILVPRMTGTEIDAIVDPANGLLVYCTDDDHFFVNRGTPDTPDWTMVNSQWITSGADIYYFGDNVGIGNPAPSGKLDVVGDDSVRVIFSAAEGANDRTSAIMLRSTFGGDIPDLAPRNLAMIKASFDGGAWGNAALAFHIAGDDCMTDGDTDPCERMRITAAGNVGIGTSTPDNSALLDMASTTKGFLPPRMTAPQISAISSPADGLIVYCTTDSKFYAYSVSDSIWKEILFGSGAISTGCDSITINHEAGDVAPVSKTVTYRTIITNLTGSYKCWITQNLGADHQAIAVNDATEASAGWYWQFNRKQGYKHDGTTRTPNTTWIWDITELCDWQPANDPCALLLGPEWRLPSYTEWNNADTIGGWDNYNETFASLLKLHPAGLLDENGGHLYGRGSFGQYYSNSSNAWQLAYGLRLTTSECYIATAIFKTTGCPARCLRD